MYATKKDLAFFDTETTDLSTLTGRIIELAVTTVCRKTRQPKETLHLYINPPDITHLSKKTTELTGITYEKLRNEGVSPEEAMERFFCITEGHILCAHNIDFDARFIRAEMRKTGLLPYDSPFKICTMDLAHRLIPVLAAKKALPDTNKFYNLSALTKFFNLPMEEAHRADEDVKMLIRVFEALYDLHIRLHGDLYTSNEISYFEEWLKEPMFIERIPFGRTIYKKFSEVTRADLQYLADHGSITVMNSARRFLNQGLVPYKY